MHFATVEHQDNQANDKGAGQFEGACAHQRDEAEHATQYRTNQADKVTDVDAFETNQVNTGVEVRQHGQQYRDTGQFAEQVRGFTTGGVHQGNQYHQRGHFHRSQQQAFFRDTVAINFAIHFREVAVVGGADTCLANQHHPRAQRSQAGKGGESGYHRRSPAAENSRGANRERRTRRGHLRSRIHTGDNLSRGDINDTGHRSTQHGSQRYGTFRVFHHPGTHGGGFYANEGPQAEQDTFNDRVAIGGAGGVPVRLIGSDIKPVPADDRGHHHWNKHQHQTNGGQTADPGPAEHINESKDPHDGNTGNPCWHRVI